MKYNEMEKRFKENYEMRSRQYLYRRTPVIIRLDGKAFHTFTKGLKKPFDNILIESMQDTMKYLCENIQGCVLGYTQSDEISLLLVDYQDLDSCAWFDYRLDKLLSVSASMATFAFNKAFANKVEIWTNNFYEAWNKTNEDKKYLSIIEKRVEQGALFDSRAFNLPKEEVTNYFFSRQNDATRNSIQMVGQYYFSPTELHKKKVNDIQDMLLTQKDVNWNDFSTTKKRGSCCIKNKIIISTDGSTVTCQLRDPKKPENAWVIDNNIPIFKGADREYIDKLFMIGGI